MLIKDLVRHTSDPKSDRLCMFGYCFLYEVANTLELKNTVITQNLYYQVSILSIKKDRSLKIKVVAELVVIYGDQSLCSMFNIRG